MSTQLDAPIQSPRPEVKATNGSDGMANMQRDPEVLPGQYEGNPVGLTKKSCEALGPQLDAHLAAYGILYNQYHKHHWLVKGPQFRDLHEFLQEHYEQIHQHYDAIAERLTAIGFIPTCSPTEQAKISYINHEPEGYFPVRSMLELDLLAEGTVCVELRKTISTAQENGDFGTMRLLQNILIDAEDRAHHLEHFLEDDTLEIGNIVDEDALKPRG